MSLQTMQGKPMTPENNESRIKTQPRNGGGNAAGSGVGSSVKSMTEEEEIDAAIAASLGWVILITQ